MKRIAAILLLLMQFANVHAQQKRIDSLLNKLQTQKPDTNRIFILASLVRMYYLFKPDTALALGQEAYELAEKLKFPKGEALALNRIASCYSTVGDYPKALQFFTRALKIAEAESDSEGIGRANNNIGDLYMTQGDYGRALDYFKKTKIIYAQSNNNYLKTITFLNIGECYLHLKQTDSAAAYLEVNYPLAKKYQFDDLYGDFERDLGETESARNNYEKAREYFNNSVASYLLLDDKQHLSMTYQSIAVFYQKYNRQDSAIHYARQALAMATSGSYNQGILNASKLLSEYYDGKDDKEAFRYFKIATAAKDSLFSQEKTKQILSMSFEEKQRQQDIERAQANYVNRIKLYILGAILLFFLLLAGLLFRNNRQKQKANHILEKTLLNLKSTQAQLVQSEKMASLGELTAGIAHEIQNPLNFVNNFSEVSNELIEELNEELDKGEIAEAKAIAGDIKQNLEKINHHGKRADAIVSGMLQHSRSSTGQKVPSDINKITDEYIRLSYHGLRAKDKTFNSDINTSFDPAAGNINIVPQEIGRVILNLLNNAFYAVNEKAKLNIAGYKPAVSVRTTRTGNKVELSVTDNGNGVPEKIADKIFNPFFTTKPAGQGTGLGLSLSYDIIKAHGGVIKLSTKEGEGSTFTIHLPYNR